VCGAGCRAVRLFAKRPSTIDPEP